MGADCVHPVLCAQLHRRSLPSCASFPSPARQLWSLFSGLSVADAMLRGPPPGLPINSAAHSCRWSSLVSCALWWLQPKRVFTRGLHARDRACRVVRLLL